jgi:hypothetical protein
MYNAIDLCQQDLLWGVGGSQKYAYKLVLKSCETVFIDHYIIQGRRIIFFKNTSNFCFNVWNIYFSILILS